MRTIEGVIELAENMLRSNGIGWVSGIIRSYLIEAELIGYDRGYSIGKQSDSVPLVWEESDGKFPYCFAVINENPRIAYSVWESFSNTYMPSLGTPGNTVPIHETGTKLIEQAKKICQTHYDMMCGRNK